MPSPIAAAPVGALDALVRAKRVLVLCGAGGVGKTTTSAALALAAAQAGRRVLVTETRTRLYPLAAGFARKGAAA